MRHTMAAPTSAASSQPSAPSGITAVVGGEATATGANTLATGDVTNNIQKIGGVTIDSGEAQFTAEGSGTNASAVATSYAGVTGEDILIEGHSNVSSTSSTGVVSDVSTTKFIAIDIPGFTMPGGPIVVNENLPSTPTLGGSSLPSGNVAVNHDTVDVSTSVSEVATSSHALAVSHQLSYVSAWALVAA